jgi:hypothetical protein
MVRMPCRSNNPAALLPDAPEPFHRQRVEEVLHVARLDDQGVRLPEVAGDLGQELVRDHTYRDHQPHLVMDRLLDLPSDFGGWAEEMLAAGHAEERLVER